MDESVTHAAPEPGLFVLWENARHCQDKILADIAANFHINRVTEFHWNQDLAWANFQRFYPDRPVRGYSCARTKGTGPFVAINVVDLSPNYEERMTNGGLRVVNTNMLDAKLRYREWTGGLKVHCGEDLKENVRDLYALFGDHSDVWEECELKNWDGSIDTLRQDPVGAYGWQSFDELFGALNRSVEYVRIEYGASQDAFDILTSDYRTTHTILSSDRRIPAPLKRGGQIEILVAGQPVRLNLQYKGDGVFDKRWATTLLESRVLDAQGYYRPSEEEQYWLIAHKAVARLGSLDQQALAAARRTAADQHMLATPELPVDDNGVRAVLANELIRRGIWQPGVAAKLGTAIQAQLARLGNKYHVLAARARTHYLAVRDTVLYHLPVLNAIRRSLKTLTAGG
jgi:hypothetical protein